MRTSLVAALVVTVGAVAGCTPVRYEYTAPADAEGRTCADRCLGTRQQCESRARITDQQCRSRYQMQMVHYDLCKRGGRRPLCITPDACPGPDYAPCTRDFNDCFADCGGTIREIEVEDEAAPSR